MRIATDPIRDTAAACINAAPPEYVAAVNAAAHEVIDADGDDDKQARRDEFVAAVNEAYAAAPQSMRDAHVEAYNGALMLPPAKVLLTMVDAGLFPPKPKRIRPQPQAGRN